MGRPHHRYQACKVCGASHDQAGHISGTGKCLGCAAAIETANIVQLRAHAGPHFHHWRRRLAASVGAMLVDDLESTG
jgi:hypothetical protein